MNEDLYHLGIKALITDEDGKILLLKVNPDELDGSNKFEPNYWDLPGGRVHKGVGVEETLAREVAEELGVHDIEVVRPIGMVLSPIRIPLPNRTDVGLVLSIYECKITNSAGFTLSQEHLAYDWCEPLKAAKRLTIKYPKEFCELIASMQTK